MSEETKGGARVAEASKRRRGKTVWIVLLCVAAALLLAYGACCALAYTSDAVFPRTTMLGAEVGGMTRSQAEEYLSEILPAAYSENGISVRMDGEEVWLASLTELGFSPRPEECADLVYGVGRSGNVLADGYTYLKAWIVGHDVVPPMNLNESSLQSAVDAIEKQLNCDPHPIEARLDENDTGHVFFTQAHEGVTIDRETLLGDMAVILEKGALASVECAYTTQPFDAGVTVATLSKELQQTCRNATYDRATDSIGEAVVGVVFDEAEAERLVAEAKPGEEVAVPGTVEFPHVYADELRPVLFRDVIGTYSTKLTGGKERISNVILAARACNGTVLNSGDVFSFNGTVGKRSTEKGYQAAPGYLAGETVDMIGGGICQVSSTIYYACLLANLEITSRTAHRYVSSYIPYGMDATVSWGTLDYKFTNNTDYPIKIVTSISNGSIHVFLYGTKTDTNYVTMTYQVLSTTGWETVYEETEDLPAGKEEVKQTPYTGRKVQSYRNIYAADGTLISSTPEAYSDYKARDKIILVGKKQAAPPASDPSIGDDPSGGLGDDPSIGGDPSGGIGDGGSGGVTPPSEPEYSGPVDDGTGIIEY